MGVRDGLSVGLEGGSLHYFFALCSHFAETFYHKWVLGFIKCFFYIYRYEIVVIIFHFVYVANHIYWLRILYYSLFE